MDILNEAAMIKHIIFVVVVVGVLEILTFVIIYLLHIHRERKAKKSCIDRIQCTDIVFIKVDGNPKRFQVIAVYSDRIKVIDNQMRIAAYPKNAVIF